MEEGAYAKPFATVMVTPVLVDTSTSFTGELVYCPGETLNTSITVSNTGAMAQWFKGGNSITGANGLAYAPSSVGTYWAEIRQFGCLDSSRRFIIHESPFPKADFITNKEAQCVNEPIVFTNRTTISGNEPVKYEWNFSDGSSSQLVNTEKVFKTDGVYIATLLATSGQHCVDSFQKEVLIIDNCDLVLPTAFTPNNDGKNDKLTPFLAGIKTLKRFTVYNRWGNIVFTTTREGEGWNGTYDGRVLPTDVFVWTIEYIDRKNQRATKKGTVTLIR